MAKADEVKQQTTEKADKAEHAVQDKVGKVEQSKVGQKIPTAIQNVDFKHIIYATLLMILFSTIPIYLFIGTSVAVGGKIMRLLYKVCQWAFLICGIGGVFFDIVVIAAKLKFLFRLTLFLKAIKIIAVVISFFIVNLKGKFDHALYALYAIGTIILDLIFVYYATIFFGRLTSDQFDDDGNPKTKDEDKKKDEAAQV